ncbi:MAG: substrate-binding domain-containing protein [Verrucomicrobiota bacterium]
MTIRLNHLFLLFLLICTAASAQPIRIGASDLLSDYIKEPILAYANENNLSVIVESTGTLPALDRLGSDEIDLAIIAVPEGTESPRNLYRVYPIAYDVAIVAVNSSNPIDEISVSSLGGIFGTNEELNHNTWGDLGLTGWGNRSIKPLAGMTPDSISLELFKHSVFTGSVMKPGVTVVNDDEVENLLASDAASIAILSRLPRMDSVKALMVSGRDGGPAFGPTEDNVHFGDYPIRLSFFIAFKDRDEEEMTDIMRVLLSDEVAESLSENNLYPLPYTVRRKLIIDLDLEK